MRTVVAGTFGPIHDGHRQLFSHALRCGEEGVVVGLTTDALAAATRETPRPVPPFTERQRAVREECRALDEWGRDVTVEAIEDRHDIAVSDSTLEAIVCSPETVTEIEAINDRRRDRGYEPLTGIVAPYVLADDGRRISSTRIVQGVIDEHGAVCD